MELCCHARSGNFISCSSYFVLVPNLYATFIKRCYEFTGEEGKIAMIHPYTFMFIKTFEDVRKFIIEKSHIELLADWGLDRVNLFDGGYASAPTFYVLSKKPSKVKGLYFNLTTSLQESIKKSKFFEALDDFFAEKENDRIYQLEQSKLKNIKSLPFIYWISDEFRAKFASKNLEGIADVKGGITTGSNERFLRFWWEVDTSDISKKYKSDKKKWVGYAKGGGYNRWYGNDWLKILWDKNGEEVKNSPKSVMRNSSFYLKKGITYSAAGSKGTSFRYLSDNNVFDAGGSCIFVKDKIEIGIEYLLAMLNSKVCSYIIDCLNPTVNTQVGDIERIAIVTSDKTLVNDLAATAVQIKKRICNFTIVEQDYLISPAQFAMSSSDIKTRIKAFFNYENHLLTQVLINEAIINEKIFEIYDLTPNDKAMVLAKEGESIGGLPVSEEARVAYLVEEEAIKEFPRDNIQDFINALPVKEFTAEAQEAIEAEFSSLYQNNNNLEAFCSRHKINPINVWYWFKQSNVIPKQRMNDLALEFLADMIREILMEDEDGIIPLVPNAGEKILLDRIEEKFRAKGFTTAQFANFDSVLGRPLNDYLNTTFFAALSDHLNLFMYLPKTPFIWHLSSGPEQGFDCYIIIYKWSRDKLMRIRSVYIEHRERALMNRQSDLANNDSADAQNEKEKIFKQLKEIEAFKVKIDELLAEGYNPILDDGVGKNIAPLQKKKMIPYEVLNPGQLKKYLNADW